MRRKSERNKAKQASPEKKIEKPTRKSTRRRAKKSPSTSPERDNSNDAEGLQTSDKESYKIQTRLHSKETENIIDEPETKVSSTETITDQQDVVGDSGSVWKAARADASPGEIPKLKLCRQRNLSETSDVSLNRKRTSKWQESGGEGGVAEEADSADERPAMSLMMIAGNEPADNPSSTIPGRDSGEEVSDSKEFPPENASADLSDDKPNIDRHDDTNETTSCTATTSVDNEQPAVSDTIPEIVKTTNTDANGEQQQNEEKVDQDQETIPGAKDANIDEETRDEVKDCKAEPERKLELNPEQEPSVEIEAKAEDNSVAEADMKEKGEAKVESESKPAVVAESKVEEKSKMIAVEEAKEEKELKTATVTEVIVEKESRMTSVVEEEEEEEETEESIRKDTTSSDDEEVRKKPIVERLAFSDNSNDGESSENAKRTARAPTRAGRRKHRDKYRDSSNSESVDSDDEPTRIKKKIEEHERTPDELQGEREDNEKTEKSMEPGIKTSSIPNDRATEVVEDVVTDDTPKTDSALEKMDQVAASVEPTQVIKVAKVNLKRTFCSSAARISVDGLDTKKDDVETNDATQNKENHVSGDQLEPNIIPKRRRWGTAVSTDVTPTFSISTDFLKTLVPGAKPLSISEVRLSKDDDEERNRRRDREKRYVVTDGPVEKSKEDIDPAKVDAMKGDNHIATRRKISIVKDTSHAKSPSPLPSQQTNILLIKNLVRPFTLNQIKELLSRTGTIVENGFWMDRIKSKCFVEYLNEDQAFETRQALHGISWPPSNPKKLYVEYASKEDMDQTRELSKDQTPLRKSELTETSDVWPQEWGRDEKSNTTTKVTVVREWDLGKEDGQHLIKDKEREKKDMDKKRRQRSRSPGLDSHLPAPARKFKKKEDEPPPAKLLDDLFRKTKATPCIYWLPLTNEQIVVKEEMRRQHMAEHARRLEEMRRAERNRDGRRRRSPRK